MSKTNGMEGAGPLRELRMRVVVVVSALADDGYEDARCHIKKDKEKRASNADRLIRRVAVLAPV